MRLLKSITRFPTRLISPALPILSARPLMSSAPEAKASTSTSTLPKWTPPSQKSSGPVLKLQNSLSGKAAVPFVPRDDRNVTWYNCGPTTYAPSHMGHGRNYLSQDIIRRILRDYFGYNVYFVMNITDIDDKIIVRSSEEYLLKQTKRDHATLSTELVEMVKTAFEEYLDSKLVKCLPSPVAAPSSATALERFAAILEKFGSGAGLAEGKAKDEKFEMHINSLKSAREAIAAAEEKLKSASSTGGDASGLVDASADILGPYLRSKLGHTIQNPVEVAGTYAKYWEEDFFKDTDRLQILRPDRLTRVSEYVPEIVSFVEKIQDNGFAYEAEGSVYFDVVKFDGAEGNGFRHDYAKLAPESKGNKELIDEGEGALTGSKGKRHPADFALWKARSKPGEPAWQSRRWGEGRPGWHIECSVMASDVLGAGMDIHSGGVDLKFPHHDNELAQSEAYHGCSQWVNYFLHTGHLHIHGSKMSKSLKNFTTIDDALKIFSPRQLRLAFMSVPWSGPMNYEEEKTLAQAKNMETEFNEFFKSVQGMIGDRAAQPLTPDGLHHYDQPDRDLEETIRQAQAKFHERLCDSIDTPGALRTLQDLVKSVNTYRAERGQKYNLDTIRGAAEWITRMLLMFGLGEGSIAAAGGQIGWGKQTQAGGGGDMDDKLVRAFAAFRDEVRECGMKNGSKDLLELCDRLRDEQMVELGIQLEDGMGAGGRALVKREDPAVLIKQREEKAALAADKAAKKAANAAAAEKQKQAQLEKGRTPPNEMFKPPHSELYSAWDDNGLPTKDKEGSEVSKAGGKKLLKEWKAQEKAHEAFLAWQRDGQ